MVWGLELGASNSGCEGTAVPTTSPRSGRNPSSPHAAGRARVQGHGFGVRVSWFLEGCASRAFARFKGLGFRV